MTAIVRTPVPPRPGTPGRLEQALRSKRAEGRKLLVPYVTAGVVPEWVTVVEAVAAAGADAIEIGIPFSDPMIDGPVIQEASVRALEAGMTPPRALDGVAGADVAVPLVVMTYYNIVYRAGHRRAARDMVAAGVAAALLPDLSLEELGDWAVEADQVDLETVLMVAPSTPPGRVASLCARCRGFVYAVSRMGVTGERTDVAGSVPGTVAAVRAVTDLPVLVGMGVSTPDQAVDASRHADGAVVGSALIRRLLEGGGPESAADLVGSLRRALDA